MKYWRKRTTILEFLTLQGNSQNRASRIVRLKYIYHNKRILNSSKHTDKSTDNPVDNKSCNCRQNNTCPLNGNCLQSSVIYQATVKRNDNNTSETYIGLTENAFKTTYRNHTVSFRHTKHRNSTELSKHVWSLKTTTLTILFHGVSFHLAHPTTVQVKDVTYASKRNF